MKENALLKVKPNLIDEWDFEKNDELGLDIYKVTKGSKIKAWWICLDCKSSYDLRISHKVNGTRCKYCSGHAVNYTNSLVTMNPALASQWHPVLNGDLTPHDITYKKELKVWWLCDVCESDYFSSVYKRSKGSGCPYCTSILTNHTNSLATANPSLAKEWHPTLNGVKTPNDFTKSSQEKVWWLGKCGHEWEAVIDSRNSGRKCSICNNKTILKGFNDMWTTNPELASLLADPEDGYKYMQFSNKRVHWKCPECENTIKSKVISSICNEGLSCPKCSDGIKFPEKFMYNLLTLSGIDFVFQKKFNWSKGKVYDFYLTEYNWIIETHGIQHYVQTNRKGARSLEEEKSNDDLKQNMANENNISNYVIINSTETTLESMRKVILSSDLSQIAKDKDFIKVLELTNKSLIKIACNHWNSGIRNTSSIGNLMNLSTSTVSRYLKRGAEIGWCDYDSKEVMKNNGKVSSQKRRKPIVQLSKENEFIKHWDSATRAGNGLDIPQGSISTVCRGVKKTAYGFKWMYKEDYDKASSL